MAKIVFVGAMSHAPGATGWPEKADPVERASFYDAAKEIGERIIHAQPDVIIGFANDHVLNFNLSNFPDFAINIGQKHTGPADWFVPWLNVPNFELDGHPEIASMLYNGMIKRGLNMASTYQNFQYDDNYSVPLTLTGLTTAGIPFIPIMMNCTVPPVIPSQEMYRIGQLFKETIEQALPSDLRVAVLATGGLSHEPGGPKYFVIDEQFDRWVLDLLENSDPTTVIEQVTYEKMEEAGSGGTSELLSWFLVMAIAGSSKCKVLSYAAIQEWRCGMGVAYWELNQAEMDGQDHELETTSIGGAD